MRDTIDFGIDLGTTNSAIAVVDDGDVCVIKNNDGWDFTPSAVWIPKPDVVHVGRRARERTEKDPDSAAAEFKLEMGLAGAGRRFAKAGVTLSPEQLSAEVLKSLRGDAAHQCGALPDAAVITVPASFTLNQNNATSEAATLAGFGAACPLVQEPTAAAFAYGFQDTSDRAYWMVFDFGGGTFDAAMVSKREGELQVLNHAGDPYLGGKLIDWAIVERLLVPAVGRALGLADFRRDNPAWRVNFAILKLAAEDAKIHLSRGEFAEITVELDDGRGGSEPFEHTLRRGDLERIAEPFYSRAINRCRDALTEGNLDPDDIDRLLLVGGTTRAPALRERLADPQHGLGIALDFSQDPTTVVARGAALFASTVRADPPPVAPKAGEFTIELAYEPSVTTTEPTVAGRLHSAAPVDWTGYSVTLTTNPVGHPPFRSPRIALDGEGTFATEVRVIPQATSRFTVELTDAAGARQKLSPCTLSIRHGDVEFGGAVLTHSLGIGIAGNTFIPMLRKGTALPATTRAIYQTTNALRRSDTESLIRIPVVEGERGRTDRNFEVAMLEIRPRDVRIDLPAGSDVEVTFEIDKSRLVTVVADVPLVQAQFEAEIDLSNVRPPSAEALQEQLGETETRLARLRTSAETVGSSTARRDIAKLDEEGAVESARDQVRAARVDAGAGPAGEKRLRDLQAVLDDVEDAVQLPGLLSELQEAVDECADLVDRSGQADDRRELADLQSRARTAIEGEDPVAARAQLDRARGFFFDLMRRGPEWDLTFFHILRNMRHELQPADRADALIREGERAIAAGDRHAVAGVNERLRRLIPPNVQDPIIELTKR